MTDGCGAHAGIPDDLRVTARQVLERLRSAVEPLAAAGDGPPEPGSAGACTACPVCAVLAALRGERSELAANLAEHATGLITALLAALEEPAPPPARPAPHDRHRPHGGRSVQRIVVHRT